MHPDRNNVAPRVGMAYSLNEKTVLRSAYGMSYIHFNRLGGENLLSFNGPHVVPIAVTQQPSQGTCAPNQSPITCFRPTQVGYPGGSERARPTSIRSTAASITFRTIWKPATFRAGTSRCSASCPAMFVVDLAYVGNRSDHLMILGDLNQARPNANGENTPLQNRAVRSRAISSSRPRSTAGRATTARCR